MATKKTDEVVTEIVKKKPRGGNNILTDAALDLEKGDNTKYLALGRELFNLPTIDLKDPVQVTDRLNEFFMIHEKYDMKPTVAGMGMALGLDRRRLWEIKTGNFGTQKSLSELPTMTKDSIKKAYEYMELLWENYMQNGKINPVSGIFLGKNNFGYQDKQEMVLTPNTNNEPDYDIDAIKKRLSAPDATLLIEDGENDE